MSIKNYRLIWHAAAACVMPLTLQPAAAQESRVASVVVVDSRKQPEAAIQTAESSRSLVNFALRQVTGGPKFECRDAVKRRDDLVKPRNPAAKASSDSAKLPELRQLKTLIDCATGTESVPVRSAAAELVAMMAKEYEDESSLRITSLKGDNVRIVVVQAATEMATESVGPVIVRGALPRIKFTEDARKSQISTDIETFVQLAAEVFQLSAPSDSSDPAIKAALDAARKAAADSARKLARAAVKDRPITWLTRADQPLKLRRSSLSLEISPGSGANVLWSMEGVDPEVFQEHADARRCGRTAPSSVAQLACLLKDADLPSPIRVASATALGESGSSAAMAPLRAAAESEVGPLRVAVIEALGKLRVTAPTPQAPPQAAQPGQPAAASPASGSTPQVTKAKLLTGPNEHWFLTTDVPVTSAETFAFDEDTDQLDLVEEPSRFYVGLGFLFGDLASDDRSLLGNLVLKAMITLSKRPLDSYGFAIGLRGSPLKRLGVDFETLTPFIGYTFSLEDTVDSAGQVQEKGRRNKQLRFGVSLNLDRATSWMEQ